jgi:spermidine/putrescine transport system substrate-binding protein
VRGGLNRRELLRGGAGLAVGAGLAGCGVGNVSRGSKEETEKPIKKRVDGDLVYFNYSEYVDPALIKGFEKEYGVKVRESYFDSMPAMMAKLRAGIQYDGPWSPTRRRSGRSAGRRATESGRRSGSSARGSSRR